MAGWEDDPLVDGPDFAADEEVTAQPPRMAKTRSALQGLSFGFGDEAVAALVAGARQLAGDDRSFIDIYEEVAQNERDQLAEYRELEPVKAFLSEGAGALLTGGAAGSRLLAREGMKKLPKWLSVALVGGLEGTVYGAGAADPGERLEGALKTGALSFIGTPVISSVAKVATKLVGDVGSYAIKRLMATPESEAVTLVREAAKQAGLKAEDVVARYEKLGPDGLLLDTDENFRGLMRALADRLGPAKRQARDVLEERQVGQLGRLANEIEDASGMAADDYIDSIKRLAEQRAQSAAPFYTRAFDGTSQVSQKMAELAQRPAMRSALARGARMAANEGDAAGEGTFKLFHYAKMSLDDQIGQLGRNGKKVEARALVKLKNELLSEMDEVSPDYRAGRDLYASDSALLEAADTGRKFYSLSLDEISESLAGMAQSEREMFKRGAVKAIIDKLGDSQITFDNAKRLTNTPALQAKLSTLFKSKDAAARFIEQVGAEREFTRTRNVVTGGSPTSQNLAVAEGVEDLAGTVSAVRGDAVSAGLAVVGKLFGKKQPSAETIQAATDLLLKRSLTEAEIRKVFKQAAPAIEADKVTKALNALRGTVAPTGAALTEAATH